MSPKVSIIMPVYNAEAFLPKTLEAIQAQTLSDFELIVVNDGSTDKTAEILANYSERDARIKVIYQENGGEGAARITGLAHVTGEWLAHIDADDEPYPTFLEDSVAQGEATDADIVIFKAESFDNQTGVRLPLEYAFRDYNAPTQVFDPLDMADTIFLSFQNWLWNKLFRMSFIKEHNIGFIDIKRSADIPFTCEALVAAKRIALLDKVLYSYRVNNSGSAFATSYVNPLGFYEGFKHVRSFLKEQKLWDTYRVSFDNWVNYSLYSNLVAISNTSAFDELLDVFKNEGFKLFELDTLSRRHYFRQSEHDFCAYAMTHNNDDVRAYVKQMRIAEEEEERKSC